MKDYKVIISETNLISGKKKYYHLYLNPIKRNLEVKMFNTFFFHSPRCNNHDRKNKRIFLRFDNPIKVRSKKMESLKDFFLHIGYDIKRRIYRNCGED